MPVPMSLFCCLLPAVLSASALASQDRDKVDAQLWAQQIVMAATEEMERSGLPSLQIAIGHDGKIVFEGAYGLADVENNAVATTETRYRTASVSKWMTAAAVMRLVEEGTIDLDVPIQSYCPQYPEKRWPVTTRHLLTHTSGIRHYADYESELSEATTNAERAEIERRRDRDALGEFTRYTDVAAPLENFKNDPLRFKPGSKWLYTSFGYRVLGCVLEGAAGRSYQTVMQEDIFDRAGMTGTVPDDAWQIVPHRAAGYRVIEGEPLRRADMRDVSENLPAGGHLATAGDLVSFALAFKSQQLVSAFNVSLMSRPLAVPGSQAMEAPSWRDAIPSEEKYGYGVMFFPTGSDRWLGHSGQQAGASAIVMQAPDSDLSIAVMTNAKGWQGYISFTGTIRAIVEEALFATP